MELAARWKVFFLQITTLIPVLKNTLWEGHWMAQSHSKVNKVYSLQY